MRAPVANPGEGGQYMVRCTAKSTYFKELLFPFFKIFYTIIVHYVINFVFSIGKQPYRDVINFVSYIHAGLPTLTHMA